MNLSAFTYSGELEDHHRFEHAAVAYSASICNLKNLGHTDRNKFFLLL